MISFKYLQIGDLPEKDKQTNRLLKIDGVKLYLLFHRYKQTFLDPHSKFGHMVIHCL